MFKCVSLTINNLKDFRKINTCNKEFNELNKDFFELYDGANFFEKSLLKRQVKLLKDNTEYIGYIWVIKDDNLCIIKSINSIVKSFDAYKTLIDTLDKDSTSMYLCKSSEFNSNILKELGFKKEECTLDMCKKLDNQYKNIINENEDVTFEKFIFGKHEELRCNIQNEIFKSDDRVPITVDSIYLDELQDYYYEKGCIFIKYKNDYAGYGQIIIENNVPYIVNFGILKNFRKKGLSKLLLKYLLNIAIEDQFKVINIKVNEDNKIALNLYKSMDFKKFSDECLYIIDK